MQVKIFFYLNDLKLFEYYRKTGAKGYRFGFNGTENNNDVKGWGNQQDCWMRIYDPRVGRFLSVDPITKSYPMLTPYLFASNSPIDGIDVDGLVFLNSKVSQVDCERIGKA